MSIVDDRQLRVQKVGAGFNRSYWARVEKFIRDLSRNNSHVYVITGPLFLAKTVSEPLKTSQKIRKGSTPAAPVGQTFQEQHEAFENMLLDPPEGNSSGEPKQTGQLTSTH